MLFIVRSGSSAIGADWFWLEAADLLRGRELFLFQILYLSLVATLYALGLGKLIVAVGEETSILVAALTFLTPILTHFVLKTLDRRL
jgi:hypothetical protein